MKKENIPANAGSLQQRHFQLGWLTLLVFLTLGIVLESFHGFKVGAYVNPSNATRRLVWTLSHAHGTLLGLVHVAFAVTLGVLGDSAGSRGILASQGLLVATVLLPGGFFLGGFGIHGADPGLGIWLVPAGALALLFSVGLTWMSLRNRRLQ